VLLEQVDGYMSWLIITHLLKYLWMQTSRETWVQKLKRLLERGKNAPFVGW